MKEEAVLPPALLRTDSRSQKFGIPTVEEKNKDLKPALYLYLTTDRIFQKL